MGGGGTTTTPLQRRAALVAACREWGQALNSWMGRGIELRVVFLGGVGSGGMQLVRTVWEGMGGHMHPDLHAGWGGMSWGSASLFPAGLPSSQAAVATVLGAELWGRHSPHNRCSQRCRQAQCRPGPVEQPGAALPSLYPFPLKDIGTRGCRVWGGQAVAAGGQITAPVVREGVGLGLGP